EFRALPSRLTLREFANAARRWIAGYRPPGGAQLEGTIDGPPKPRGFIFVGTFTGGVPQGAPASGTVLLRRGAFRIERPATPDFHLLAVLIPFSASLNQVVANLPVGLVANQRCREIGRAHV